MTASDYWAEALALWAIPEEILKAAPESPWAFPPEVFEEAARRALAGPPRPTHRRVGEALGETGRTLIDVGCGSGAASIPLADRVSGIIAVDQSQDMLEAFRRLAGGRVTVQLVCGRWPDVSPAVAAADIVVCSHVAYNVADLGPFVEALTDHARSAVVMELTAVHPQTSVSPFWERMWGLTRPASPVADDVAAVVRQVTGSRPSIERWYPEDSWHHEMDIEWLRRRLCLPPERREELRAVADEIQVPPMENVTMCWPGRA